ncbi:MAG TPA: hypothetical protein VEY69_04860, partial [Lautropia sp.]|nr:hypothetical protein [Lautropia sp.]
VKGADHDMDVNMSRRHQGNVTVDVHQLETALLESLGRNPSLEERAIGEVASQVFNKLEKSVCSEQRRRRMQTLTRARRTLIGWVSCFVVGGIYAGITSGDWLILNVALSMITSGTIMWSMIEVCKDRDREG